MPGGRIAFFCAVAGAAGLTLAWLAGIQDPSNSVVFHYGVLTLLAVGLYGSTHGIVVDELRANLKTVLLAVTVGVLLKVVIIAGVMASFGRPEYLVLAVAVAQIDPLSVAALQNRSEMSPGGKAILRAWAAFDDPVTVLLTIYLSAFLLTTNTNGRIDAFVWDLVLNIGVASVAWFAWKQFRRHRLPPRDVDHWKDQRIPGSTSLRAIVAVTATIAVAVVSISLSLMLAVALIGLFARPASRFDPAIQRSVQIAFVLATGVLGIALMSNIKLLPDALFPGVVLGIAAFGAQAVVALVLTRGRSAADRRALALCQQNGLTAIILALVLEGLKPGMVAVVAPAILVVNLLHFSTNRICQRRRRRPAGKQPTEQPSPAGAGSAPTPVDETVRP